ncbi:penicillin-binding protein 1C [Puteibacter caeruleilacunae]|nr:penicillin-binding protein 1C [Puteibacter caeruleilacunae]
MNFISLTYWQSKRKWVFLFGAAILLLVYWLCLPAKLFDDPTSTILYGRKGKLLGARIADDGQWRFPERGDTPEKFATALITFEDQYFRYHPGINPVALGRAVIQDIKAGKIVSGGSTLSMQLVRIARKGKSRNIYQKLVEMIWATRLELRYSKDEILALYASHAPFGGNVVGIDAAAWRYFGRDADDLSWAEAAMLAVLPNAPSLIYPGKNSIRLKRKRDRLLDRLCALGTIDSTTCKLAKMEEVPQKIHRLPQTAQHLLDRAHKEHKGECVTSAIDEGLQQRINHIVSRHQHDLEANEIHNMAVLVLDVEHNQSIAYIGNTRQTGKENHGNQVDVIRAPRSTGSVLKPFLFASMLHDGEILPNTLIADIPTQIAGYSPKNFNLHYDGAVPAQKALSRSLNVPSVRMLRDYGVERLHYLLKKMGMETLNRPASHYGLSLILGGAEGKLWELCGMYGALARCVKHYNTYDGLYFPNDLNAPQYVLGDSLRRGRGSEESLLGAASAYQTLQALLEVNRPDGESGWKSFSSARKVGWKTGTSFGFRDAWAIGVTPDYVVGVWVGNADGEGRPGLTGVSMAAPLMFDVFGLLPETGWFDEPYDDMVEAAVCRESGALAGRWCEHVDTILIAKAGLRSGTCKYHQLVHLDATRRYRVNADCELVSNMVHQSWFVLPPAMEWYYKQRNPLYRPLPPYREDCNSVREQQVMELIYPRNNDRIFVPIELDGTRGKVVFELAHQNPQTEVFWHLDGEFIGSTCQIHQKELNPDEGDHVITFVDEQGHSLVKKFTIVGADDQKLSQLD